MRRFGVGRRWRVAGVSLVLAAAAVVGQRCGGAGGSVPAAAPHAEFAGRASCAPCHPREDREWSGSAHDLALDAARPDTVLGNFEDRPFVHQGVPARFYRRGGEHWVETEGEGARTVSCRVDFVIGSHPLQQYLVGRPGGRLQVLPYSWDVHAGDWFHVYPGEAVRSDDPLHWTGRAQSWNSGCADCHSTGLRKQYDAERDVYRTTFVEIDVSCEACHGPRAAHAARAAVGHPAAGDPPLRLASSRTEVEACAPCHSRRRVLQEGHRPGRPFADGYALELLDTETYHPDGQLKEEAFEVGSFLQSRMHLRGVRCTHCHDPHTGRLRAEGNALCVRCHSPGAFDTPSHHRHLAGSTGAQCVSCHMPESTYMVVDPRRDHSLRVPRPDLSAKLGTPDACTRCHADRTPAWAAERVAEWYGASRRREPHFGEAVLAGRRGLPEGERLLADWVRHPEAGGFVRAGAAALLGRYGGRVALDALRDACRDPDPLVRQAAARASALGRTADDAAALAKLAVDPVRGVRIEAARTLSAVPAEWVPVDLREAQKRALDEVDASERFMSEQPGARLNLGVLREARDDPAGAEAEYRAALRLDPQFTPARTNLATLLSRRGRTEEVEQELREAIRRAPDSGEAQYLLGLHLAETPSRLGEAAAALGRAVELDPRRARARYNLGLALDRLGRTEEAIRSLDLACALEPSNLDALYALALLFARAGRWDDARRAVDRLLEAEPDRAEWRSLRAELDRRRR